MSAHHDQTFERIDFGGQQLSGNAYDDCRFVGCGFANAILSGADFVDCVFEGSNLSMVRAEGCALKGVVFRECKLVGFDFGKCSDFLFAVTFERCNLDFASFAGRAMKHTVFEGCSLKEASFEGADLTGSRFSDCELERAVFSRTKLGKVDFRTARGFVIDPDENQLAKARFSLGGLPGLVAKYGVLVD